MPHGSRFKAGQTWLRPNGWGYHILDVFSPGFGKPIRVRWQVAGPHHHCKQGVTYAATLAKRLERTNATLVETAAHNG